MDRRWLHVRVGCATDAGRPRGASFADFARGAVLLEVILALALFVAAATVILGGFSASMRSAQQLKIDAQASDLAVTVLSEIQMGVIPPTDMGPSAFDDPTLSDWSLQIVTAPQPTPNTINSNSNASLQAAGLLSVEVILVHTPTGYTHRVGQLVQPPLDASATPPSPGNSNGSTPTNAAPGAAGGSQ